MLSDEQISKTLSFWLRHRPDAANLILDERGWANVDDVLAALTRNAHEIGWERLLQIVESSDKQRFELSSDACLIRARHGHSIAVNGDWAEASPPELLFHGTVERFLPSIMMQGLRPMARHHVHLSRDVEAATRVGARRGSPIVLNVHAARLASTGQSFFLTSNQVWLTASVPWEFISKE